MTTREALDQIDSLIAQLNTTCADKVWRVLTALRGPDAEGEQVDHIKWQTTAVIRAKAFPKTCAQHGGSVVGYINDGKRFLALPEGTYSPYDKDVPSGDIATSCGPHFTNHYLRALGVVEL